MSYRRAGAFFRTCSAPHRVSVVRAPKIGMARILHKCANDGFAGGIDCIQESGANQHGATTMTDRLKALRYDWANKQRGRFGYILLWLLGVPLPVLFLIFLLRGCT